jgi:L,D-peptidoglycan transpeptidase YkuD (ErfK/YbiS/YcfS/YnhG family)
MIIEVDSAARMIVLNAKRHPCVLGRAGAVAADQKREGDGCTPLGRWPVRGVILRRDGGFDPPAGVPWRWCRESDGWCDDARSSFYNRPVSCPTTLSAETLHRTDGCYDAIVILGYNDDPARPDRGSAIFLHVAERSSTEGCIAVSRSVMAELLQALVEETCVDID